MIRRTNSRELQALSAYDPPISVFRPTRPVGPLVMASPHSGRIYPDAFLKRSGLDLQTLRQNEDAYIDELIGFSRDLDIPMINALFPRCFVDVNRDADELPSQWRRGGKFPTSARAEIGLGVIPTIISDRLPIYKRPLRQEDVDRRLQKLYFPYHNALAELVTQTSAIFGRVLLLDCHSMPGFSQLGQRRPDIILGDRHGTSCESETISLFEKLFQDRGYSVARNYPYAGGFVTSHYGQPEKNMEVIQIEINRDLYLNPVTLKRKTTYTQLRADFQFICAEYVQNFGRISALAAE